MARGNWSETERKIRPGFYNRFKAAAKSRIKQGDRGIVAMPVKSDWGPSKKVISVATEKDLADNFGANMNLTAYKLGRLALLGQPKELLLYRLVDGTEKTATITLQDTTQTPADVLKLETIYPTTRDFRVTVRPNIVDETSKDIVLYEETKLIYTFKNVSGTIDEIVKQINDDKENKWIKAEKVADGENLADVVSKPLTGGNDGVDGITTEDYLEALAEFEGYKFNGFTLDGVTDSALHTSIKAWIERNRENGNKIRAYIGGSSNEIISEANARSKSLNYEGIHNVGSTGGVLEGVEYTPAEAAVYICALGEGQDIKESLCNQTTIFENVTAHLTNEEIESSIKAGTIILRYDDGAVVVEDDVNTLTTFKEGQGDAWGNLRAIRFIDMVDEDTSLTGNRQYVGKVLNGRTGQLAVLSALKQYFETLQAGELIEDFTVEVDEELQKNAADDEFFWRWDAKYINVMKKIHGTGYIK